MQFNLSDFLCFMLIVGAFPILFTPWTDFPAIVFVLGALLEIPGLLWGAELCRSWKVKNFAACFGVHVYAFAAFLSAAVFIVCCVVLSIHVISGLTDLRQKLFTWLVLWAVTGALGASIFMVERRRRAQKEPRA